MILTCPSCATSYFVADEVIGPDGRTVRCKACAKTWKASTRDQVLDLATTDVAEVVANGSAEVTDLAETPAPELPKAFRAKAEQQRRLQQAAIHGATWSGIASLFAALLGAAWLFRVEVVETFPRAASAYAAVGARVNPTGLDFEAVTARASPFDPGRVLISGALRNVRDNEVIAPPVRLALLDAHGAEIGHTIVSIDAAPVLPGRVQGFAAFINDPGARGAGVGVAFADASQVTVHRSAPGTGGRVNPVHHQSPPAEVGTDHNSASGHGSDPHTPPSHDAGLRGIVAHDGPASPVQSDLRPAEAPGLADVHGQTAVRAVPLETH